MIRPTHAIRLCAVLVNLLVQVTGFCHAWSDDTAPASAPVAPPDIHEVVIAADQRPNTEATLALDGHTVVLYSMKQQLRLKSSGQIDPNVVQATIWIERRGKAGERPENLWSATHQQVMKPGLFNYTDPYGFSLSTGPNESVGIAYFDDNFLLFRDVSVADPAKINDEAERVERIALAGFIRKRLGSANGEHHFRLRSFRFEDASWIVEFDIRENGERFTLKRIARGQWVEVSAR